MTLLAAVFHLCVSVNTGHVDTACRSRDVVTYANEIRRSASRYALDPYVLAALIQRESAFNPVAVSPVGAFGLTQTMRGGATKGYDQLSDTELMAPALNIRLGARHLAMWRKFCGSLAGALSVYSGRGRCRPSSYSDAIIGHALDVKGRDLS